MIPTMNWKLSNPVSYGEWLSWIGLWVLMSTVDGSDRRSFWSSKEVNIYEGAPFRLMKFMSQNRFEEILGVILGGVRPHCCLECQHGGRIPPKLDQRN